MKYIDYQKEFAEGVAELRNESLENWPEGLDPKLKTAEEIEKELALMGCLKIILALTDSNKVVGYCDLLPSPIQKDVCYINTLNVHPMYQGLGIGRKLLKEIINFATREGYNRIDAFTWPSNIRAISLYKKLGFFWQPNTSVQMVNFIPKLFNENFLDSKFKNKWDKLLQVRPIMGQDKFQKDGRLYYPYLFKEKQNLIEIWIDKLSQCVFHYKTPSVYFIISSSGLMFHGDDHKVEIKTNGFQINNAKFYSCEDEYKIDISQNIAVIPSKMHTLSDEAIFKVFAQCDSRKFEFGVGFYKHEKIEPLDRNQFIPAGVSKVGFQNLKRNNRALICKVYIEKPMRKTFSYQIDGGDELFAVDISNILTLLPAGIHKIKFVFKEKSERKKIIATIDRFLIIGDTQNMFHVKLGKDMLIWLKSCCCFIKNPGAKLVIHSHNLIERGLVYANYDRLSNNKEDIETMEFTFQCRRKDDKIILRAISKELTKIYIFKKEGNIEVNYKLSKPLTILSTAYFMDESAILKIDAKEGPITMLQKDGEKLIKQYNRFHLLTYSHRIAGSLHKNSTKEIEFTSNRITYKVCSPSENTISSAKWQIRKRRKKLILPSKKMGELIENIKVRELLKNNFICDTKHLSLAVDPSFGLGIYSLKFNNREILLTAYPKVGQLGENWPWYGGLYTLGCLANREVVDSFKELCLEEKTEMYSITSYHNRKNISGIFIKTAMNNVSGLKTAHLNTYYFLFPHELIIISKFQNENQVPMPCYFSSIAYIKPFSDMLLTSDVVRDKIMLSEEHLEIPGERMIKFISPQNNLIIKYLLYTGLDSNLKVINLANKKGVNLVLDIKDYFKSSDIVVQRLQFFSMDKRRRG